MSANPKTALLMIDIQQAMFGPDEICHQPERMLANAGDLLARARTAGTPVYFVQHCEAEGGFAPRSAGWQIHPKVAPRAGEPVTEKWARQLVLQDRPGSEAARRRHRHAW